MNYAGSKKNLNRSCACAGLLCIKKLILHSKPNQPNKIESRKSTRNVTPTLKHYIGNSKHLFRFTSSMLRRVSGWAVSSSPVLLMEGVQARSHLAFLCRILCEDFDSPSRPTERRNKFTSTVGATGSLDLMGKEPDVRFVRTEGLEWILWDDACLNRATTTSAFGVVIIYVCQWCGQNSFITSEQGMVNKSYVPWEEVLSNKSVLFKMLIIF